MLRSRCIVPAVTPNPIHWADPRAWPWMFDVWLAFVVAGFTRPIWRWFQREQAEGWPSTQGRIDSTAMNARQWFRIRTSSNASIASFRYSYDVGGTRYSATYRKQFGTDEESEDFLRELTGKSVKVQYNSERPSRSFLLESSINALVASRSASLAEPLEIRRYQNPLPFWVLRILPLVQALALAGFVLSVLVNVGSVTGRWTPPGYFWALHVGIFVVFFPAFALAQKRVGSTNRRDFWKVILKDAPDSMKYFLYAVFAYAFIIEVPSWIRALQQSPGPGRSSDFNDWTLFSATWMVFYWAAFAILYAALRQERVIPRCVNGHPTNPGSTFCSQCGQPVLRS